MLQIAKHLAIEFSFSPLDIGLSFCSLQIKEKTRKERKFLFIMSLTVFIHHKKFSLYIVSAALAAFAHHSAHFLSLSLGYALQCTFFFVSAFTRSALFLWANAKFMDR
jgi:hypothetical protein